MSGDWQSSHFAEGRSKPLNPNFHDSLHTQHLDLDHEDNSSVANATRSISKVVGSVCTPKQVLGLLRILKAATLVFLVLNILADLMYIVLVEFMSSEEVKQMAGGNRDTSIRLYGLGLSLMGLAIELDYSKIVKKYSGLKGFIPRAFLYLFIALITGSHPMLKNTDYSSTNENYINNDDAAAQDDDGAAQGDDDAAQDDGAYATDDPAATEVLLPASAIGFQRVTAFFLGCCAAGYLFCGLMCFDRFTARAFLSSRDPRVTTANQTSSKPSPIIEHSESSTVGQDSTVGESTVGSSQI